MEPPIRLPSGHPECPVRGILDRVGNKWTVLVISYLAAADKPLRFSELKRQIRGISQRMLTETVRGLERDGVLLRTVYPTVPQTVEYSLTALGVSLIPPVQSLVVWALDHRAMIVGARSQFDSPQTVRAPASPSGKK